MLIFKHSLALEVTPGWSLDVVSSCEGASSLLSSLSDWVTKELLQSRLLILACSRSGSAWLLAHSHHGARCQLLLLVIIASLLFFALRLELPAPGARKPLGQVFQRVCFKFLKGGKADSMFKHVSVWKVESACVAQGPMPQVELSKTNSAPQTRASTCSPGKTCRKRPSSWVPDCWPGKTLTFSGRKPSCLASTSFLGNPWVNCRRPSRRIPDHDIF